MTIFDTMIPIHETPKGEPSIDETLDKLDEMLTRYGVQHSFSLAKAEEANDAKRPTLYYLYYNAEQNTEMTLIVTLFSKLYLNVEDKKILLSVVSSLSKQFA